MNEAFRPHQVGVGIGYYGFSNCAQEFFNSDRPANDVSILDFGCGNGSFRENLNTPFEYYGCDLLDLTAPDFKYEKITPATALPYSSNSFDILIANWSLEYVIRDDLLPLLSEFARILKPGGRFFFTLCSPHAWMTYGLFGPLKSKLSNHSDIATRGSGHNRRLLMYDLEQAGFVVHGSEVTVGMTGGLFKFVGVHWRAAGLALGRLFGWLGLKQVQNFFPLTLLPIPRSAESGSTPPENLKKRAFAICLYIDRKIGVGVEYAVTGKKKRVLGS